MTTALLAICLLVGPALAEEPAAEPAPWNVLVLTVDSLRPDRMGVYGYERDTTPYLSRLAEESVVFENAFAASAWTSPGIVSMLTGYHPPVHAQNGRYSYYDAEATAPLRLLSAAGWATVGRANSGPTYEDFGLKETPLPIGDLEEWLEYEIERNRRFFAWMHIKESHLPYDPSPYHARRWGGDAKRSQGIDAVRDYGVVFRNEIDEVPYSRHPGEVTFTEDDRVTIDALYDGTVADADARIGRVLERMREVGLLDRTLVILSADHGEEVLDHGWVGHASTSWDGKVYDELVRVPLIVRVPGGAVTGRVDALVQQVDVMPTVFDLLDMEPEGLDVPMQGRSLAPLMEGGTEPVHGHVFAQTTRKGWGTPKEEVPIRVTMVRSADRKLVRWHDGRFEGFDLAEDPGETADRYAADPGAFADLRAELDAWEAANREAAATIALAAAGRRLAKLEEALRNEDLVEALDHLRAIERLHDTYAQELDPFFRHAPWDRKWSRVHDKARQRIAAALARAHKGGR